MSTEPINPTPEEKPAIPGVTPPPPPEKNCEVPDEPDEE